MIQRILAGTFAATVVLAATQTVSAAENAKLRYKFSEGQEFRYDISQKQVMQIPMPGMGEMEVKQDMVIHQVTTCTGVNADGTGAFTQVNEAAKITLMLPNGNSEFDSSKDAEPADPNLKMLAAMLGEKVTMNMTPRGKTSDVDVSAVVAAINEKVPMAAAMGADIEGLVREMSEQSLMELPEDAVAIGESFEQSTDTDMPQIGTLTATITYTLKSMDGDIANFDMSGTVKLKGGAAPGVEMSMNSSEINGTWAFDTTKGRIHDVSMSQKMDIAIKQNMGGQSTDMAMKIDMQTGQRLATEAPARATSQPATQPATEKIPG